MSTATELARQYLTAYDAATSILKRIAGKADEDAAEPELCRLDAERDEALAALARTPARTIEELKAKAAVAAREDENDLVCEATTALRHSIWADIAALGH